MGDNHTSRPERMLDAGQMSVDPELHDAKRGTVRSISDRGGSRMRKGPIARNRSRVQSTLPLKNRGGTGPHSGIATMP
jgi:hypothetical protein